MKLIIPAAGKGERARPQSENTPKPLLNLEDGRTLLGRPGVPGLPVEVA